MCKAVGGRRLLGILQPQVTMTAHRKHLAPLLLSLALGTTLVVHSRAEASRLESTVIVGRVTTQGRPVAGSIEKSSGSRLLDQAALKFVLARWHFHPALQGGVGVDAIALVPIEFSLD